MSIPEWLPVWILGTLCLIFFAFWMREMKIRRDLEWRLEAISRMIELGRLAEKVSAADSWCNKPCPVDTDARQLQQFGEQR